MSKAIDDAIAKMQVQARLRIQSYLDRGYSPEEICRAIGAFSRLSNSAKPTPREEFPE